MRHRLLLAVTALATLAALVPPGAADPGPWVPTWAPEANYNRVWAFNDGTAFALHESQGVQLHWPLNHTLLLKSSDWGVTWTPFTLPVWVTDMVMATPTRGFAKDHAYGDFRNVYRTDNGGARWDVASRTPLPPAGWHSVPDIQLDASPRGNTVAYHDWTYKDALRCGGWGEWPKATMMVSNDAATTWRRATLPFYAAGYWDGSWYDDKVGAIAVTEADVARGACWTEGELRGYSSWIWTTRDGGRSWRRAFSCPVKCSAVTMPTRDRIVATAYHGEVLVSDDAGRTVRRGGQIGALWHSTPELKENFPVHPWDVDFGTDPKIGYAITHESEIYRTTDGGATWTLDAAYEVSPAIWYRSVATADGKRAVAGHPLGIHTRLGATAPHDVGFGHGLHPPRPQRPPGQPALPRHYELRPRDH